MVNETEQDPQTVLLVDDEPDILDAVRLLLENSLERVHVLTASGGREALDLLSRQRIDLVIADYRMPEMDGLELLRTVRRSHPRVVRVMMTAYPDLKLAVAAINDARVQNFFTKPIDPDFVVHCVAQALAEARQARAHDDERMRHLKALRDADHAGGRVG